MQRFVIFSGYNQRAVIAFLRTLEKHNLPCSIIACTAKDPILSTRYQQKIDLIRDSKTLEKPNFLAWLKTLQKKYSEDQLILLPSSEYLNRFLLQHRNAIESLDIKIPLVNQKIYEKISDKGSFEELCKNYQISVPERISQITYPCIAKPHTYFSNSGGTLSPIILRDAESYQIFLDHYEEEDFYFQRYVQGESIYLLCYFYLNGTVDIFSQKNLLQQDDGKSILAAEYSDFWKNPEAEKYIALLQDQGFHGIIMIEIRKENDTYYMIEANPRPWGPSQFMIDSNANLFESMLFDLELTDQKPEIINSYRPEAKYFWKNGILEDMDRKKRPLLLEKSLTLSRITEEFERYDIYNRPDTLQLYDATVITNSTWREN